MNMTEIFGTNVLNCHNEVHYAVQWIWALEQVDSERPKNLREDFVDPKEKIIRDALEDMMTSFKPVGSEDSKENP